MSISRNRSANCPVGLLGLRWGKMLFIGFGFQKHLLGSVTFYSSMTTELYRVLSFCTFKFCWTRKSLSHLMTCHQPPGRSSATSLSVSSGLPSRRTRDISVKLKRPLSSLSAPGDSSLDGSFVKPQGDSQVFLELTMETTTTPKDIV